MKQKNRFSSSQRTHTNVIGALGVFFCAIFLSLFFAYLKTDIRTDLFFLFFIQYWLLGVGGIIFSLVLFLVQLPFLQHIGILGISYLLFIATTSIAVYYMRHNFFVLVLMFFLGETSFFLSYAIGMGLPLVQGFFVLRTIIMHVLLFIPFALLGSYRLLYEE